MSCFLLGFVRISEQEVEMNRPVRVLVGSDDFVRLALNLHEAIQLFSPFKGVLFAEERGIRSKPPSQYVKSSFDHGKRGSKFVREMIDGDALRPI
jgi:hypothetical protein